MARITLSFVEQQLANFAEEAQRLGLAVPVTGSSRQAGSVSIRSAGELKAGALFLHTESGFYSIRQLTHDNRTVCNRLFSGSLRECSTYIEGMIAGLQLVKPA